MSVLVIDLPTVVPIQQGSKAMLGIGKRCGVCGRRKMIIVDAADVSNKSGRDRLKKYRQEVEAVARDEMIKIGWEMIEEGQI